MCAAPPGSAVSLSSVSGVLGLLGRVFRRFLGGFSGCHAFFGHDRTVGLHLGRLVTSEKAEEPSHEKEQDDPFHDVPYDP